MAYHPRQKRVIKTLFDKENIEMNDKNSLCWRESIGGVALYVNGKVSTTYAVIG
jgi:hypothetical protein